MKALTVKKIAEIVGGTLLCGAPETLVTNIAFDSRKVGEGSLFVPIRGEKVDAHQFIEQCLVSGAATLTEYDAPEGAEKPYIRTENNLAALQKLAGWYRQQFGLKLIGITGSVGKTSTKEMVAAALSGGLNVMKTQGNRNSQIGMPATMFELSSENEAAVIEMGMSEFGEMDRLADIAKPDMAVMTNIGKAHIENLKTQENIMAEKLRITKHFGRESILFLNGDDPLLRTLHHTQPFRTITFGLKDDCDYYAEDIRTEGFHTTFVCVDGKGRRQFSIPALGSHSVANALAAVAVGDAMGLSTEQLQKGLSTYQNAPMRQQIYQLKDMTLIDDSYNASPEAAKVSVDVMKSISDKYAIAVLADMLELGEQAAAEHYGVGEHLAKAGTDCLIAVGPLSEYTAKGAAENGCRSVYTVKNNAEAAERLKEVIVPGCTVLVKGSRGMHTDEIVKAILEYKGK